MATLRYREGGLRPQEDSPWAPGGRFPSRPLKRCRGMRGAGDLGKEQLPWDPQLANGGELERALRPPSDRENWGSYAGSAFILSCCPGKSTPPDPGDGRGLKGEGQSRAGQEGKRGLRADSSLCHCNSTHL